MSQLNLAFSELPPSSSITPTKRSYNFLADNEKQFIREMYARGHGSSNIARRIGRSPATVNQFIKRMRQQNVSPEEAVEVSMGGDNHDDGDYVEDFLNTVEQGSYSRKQVLSFQETSLGWKMMSQLADTSDLKADRITLLMGGNAEGDLKLKPLLVYHTEDPPALKGYIKDHFPVIWKAHPQVELTPEFLQSYVAGYLSQACKEYATANNLRNKFLLVLDKHSAYPPLMGQWAENIEVSFTPTHVQPMDQGVTDIFKRHYHRRVMQQLVKTKKASELDNTQPDFWGQYNIKKAIKNIIYAWNQVEEAVMNGVWYKVWPDAVSGSWEFEGVEGYQQQLTSDIVQFSSQAGMSEVDEEGVEKLLASDAEVKSDNENSQIITEATEGPDSQSKKLGLGKKELKELLDAINKASVIAETQDLILSRSIEFSHALENAASRYQKMYDNL